MKLKDKVALITGSSRGIGKATALLFAKEGAKVVVNYFVSNIELDAEKNAKKVVDEIKNLGSDAIMIHCDVSNEEQVKEMIKTALKRFRKIDILVNNAGIVFDAAFSEKTAEQWKRTLEVNLTGSFLCAQQSASVMKKQKNGRIINVGSTNCINSFNPESIDYDASKAGIIIMTRDLAKELAPDITVNAVAPGWVDTDMNKGLSKDFVKKETEKIYLKRFAKPEEIAKAILFLASDDANYITGSILKIDGGYG